MIAVAGCVAVALPAISMPLSWGTKAGCDSLVGVVEVAELRWRERLLQVARLLSANDEHREGKLVRVAGRLAAELVDLEIERHSRWLICSVPAGCRMKPASEGSSWRSATSSFVFGGSAVRQLLAFWASAASSGITAIGGSVVFGSSPQVTSIPISIEKKKNESDAVPCTCQRRRAFEVTSMPTPYTPMPKP